MLMLAGLTCLTLAVRPARAMSDAEFSQFFDAAFQVADLLPARGRAALRDRVSLSAARAGANDAVAFFALDRDYASPAVALVYGKMRRCFEIYARRLELQEELEEALRREEIAETIGKLCDEAADFVGDPVWRVISEVSCGAVRLTAQAQKRKVAELSEFVLGKIADEYQDIVRVLVRDATLLSTGRDAQAESAAPGAEDADSESLWDQLWGSLTRMITGGRRVIALDYDDCFCMPGTRDAGTLSLRSRNEEVTGPVLMLTTVTGADGETGARRLIAVKDTGPLDLKIRMPIVTEGFVPPATVFRPQSLDLVVWRAGTRPLRLVHDYDAGEQREDLRRGMDSIDVVRSAYSSGLLNASGISLALSGAVPVAHEVVIRWRGSQARRIFTNSFAQGAWDGGRKRFELEPGDDRPSDYRVSIRVPGVGQIRAFAPVSYDEDTKTWSGLDMRGVTPAALESETQAWRPVGPPQ